MPELVAVHRCPFVSRLLLCLIVLADVVGAAELTRGPYLQTGTPNSVIIRWRTAEPTESIVLYGTEPDELHLISGSVDATTEHIVELGALDPGTRYYYSVGSFFETLAGGPDWFFYTHPIAGQPKPTRIWAIGDCGTFGVGGMGQIGVRDAFYQFAGNRYTDVWLALGDNAYFSGTDAEYQASFFDVYPRMLRQTVLWSTIGNHETYSAPGAGEPFPYLGMFSFPEAGEAGGMPSGTERYYSFDYANIHFVCLDSETSNRQPGGAMLTWLEADLAANTKDWLIAFWHSPPYTKGSHDSDNLFDNGGNMTDMRANAVRILEQHGVDLVLCGHSHIYERSVLIHGHYGFSDSLTPEMIKDGGNGRPNETGAYRKGEPAPNEGAVYVVAGSAGWATSRTGFHPIMYVSELVTGSMVIDIDGNRLDAKFLRETGAVDDSFTIVKGVGPEPLRICAFAIQNGEAVVRWKSVAGQDYRVERTNDMKNPTWHPVGDVITATGATSVWRGSLPAGSTQGFYRVVQLEQVPQAVQVQKQTSVRNTMRAARTTKAPRVRFAPAARARR
jgi:acid phosphatase type 7